MSDKERGQGIKIISKGIEKIPVRFLLYGANGVGKSHFASQFPNPIFIDTENSLLHYDVARQHVTSWEEFIEFLTKLVEKDHNYKTVVIDSLDLLQEWGKESVKEEGGLEDFYKFGKGWGNLASLFFRIRNGLEILNLKKRMHIVFISHVATRRIEPLDRPPYDMIMPALNNSILPVFANWCNFIGYAHVRLAVEKTLERKHNKIKTVMKFGERRITMVGAMLTKDTMGLEKDEERTIPNDAHAFLEQVKNFYDSKGVK